MKKIFISIFASALLFFSPQAAERIVVLSPGAAEMVLTLGAGYLLCGRCSACSAPELQALPEAGVLGLPSPEKIFSLHPTMIVTDVFRPSEAWDPVMRAGIRILRFSREKLSDYPDSLRQLGKILHRETEAEAAAARYEKEIAALQKEIPSKKKKILLIFSLSPVVTCGEKSFLTQAVALAGGESITAGIPETYFVLSPEIILAHAPEVIVAAGLPEKALRQWFSRPEYSRLPAVQKGAFLVEDPDSFCRNGPHFPAAVRRLKEELAAAGE